MIDLSKFQRVAEFKDGEFVQLDYKDNWMNSIYLILIEDEYYIGSTDFLYRRVKQHLSMLCDKSHYSKPFQNKWDQYKTFTVYVMNDYEIPKSKLKYEEKGFIKEYNPTLNGFVSRKNKTDGHKIQILFTEVSYRALWMKKLSYNMRKRIDEKEISISQIVSDIIDDWVSEHWEEIDDEFRTVFPIDYPDEK